jgi:hypothetical protein
MNSVSSRAIVWSGLAAVVVAMAVVLSSPSETGVRLGTAGDMAVVVPPRSGVRKALISLHTWGGDYRQHDPIRLAAERAGWGYIRPNLWGPNKTPKACLSGDVIASLDDCFRHISQNWNIPSESVVLLGSSGGGHAALGYWHRGAFRPARVVVWNPIVCLEKWHEFTSGRDEYRKYARDIEKVADTPLGFSLEVCRQRSPLYYEPRGEPWSEIWISAGINDGWAGSVPVWHSLAYFNRNARAGEGLSDAESARLAGRVGLSAISKTIEGRSIFLRVRSGHLTLTVFEGAHEVLPLTNELQVFLNE